MRDEMENRISELLNEILNDAAIMDSESEMLARVSAMLIAGNLVGFDMETMNFHAKELADDLLRKARTDD
jgi:hypothetical protein